MAPVIRGKKGEYAKIFEDARKSGYVRVRVDGSMYDLSEEIKLEKNIKHSIEVVVDHLILKPDVVHRLSNSAETAAALWGGLVLINVLNPEQDILFSQNYACEDCGVSIEELTPGCYRLTNPFGASRPAASAASSRSIRSWYIRDQDALHPRRGYLRVGVEQCARRRHLEDVLRRAVEEISFLAARAGGKTLGRRSWT